MPTKQEETEPQTVTVKLTSFKHYAVVWYFVSSLQTRAVPTVPSELVLALMDGNLDSLDC